MSNITVVVREIDTFGAAQVQETDLVSAATSLYNPATVPRLGDVGDVDTTNLVNGSVLVYRASTNKWTSTTTLDLQNMEGGEF